MQTQLERSLDQFTTGIVNLPILFDNQGKPLMKMVADRIKYEIEKDMRYPFFEIDNTNIVIYKKIRRQYMKFGIPYYSHRTMRGYHFFSTMALPKEEYQEWLNPIHRFNEKCPMVTLRVKANKWIGEKPLWNIGEIVITEDCTDYLKHKYALQSLRSMIERQQLGLLHNQYYLVHYKMTGELGNL